MDRKIILTNDQIHALEKWLAIDGTHYTKKDLLKEHALTIVNSSFSWAGEYKVFSELSLQDMAHALFVGYKLKIPPIKVGDRVVPLDNSWGGKILTVSELTTSIGLVRTKELFDVLFKPSHLKVVSQEEGFWYDIGRTQGDVKPLDVIVLNNGEIYIVTSFAVHGNRCTTDDALRWIKEGEIKGLYKAESLNLFPTKEPTT
jgi:hypothetical protein